MDYFFLHHFSQGVGDPLSHSCSNVKMNQDTLRCIQLWSGGFFDPVLGRCHRGHLRGVASIFTCPHLQYFPSLVPISHRDLDPLHTILHLSYLAEAQRMFFRNFKF